MDVILIYLFIVGLFLGSFYNVVALRLSNNESIVFPGSHCVNCNHKLSWYELIPVFSYIGLGGKCKKCKKHISMQYPLIELSTGILFATSYYIYGFTIMTLISIVISSVVIITFITDCKYMIILDEVIVVASIILTFLYFFEGGIDLIISKLIGGIAIFALMFLIKVLGDKAFKQESLGWGDVKLSFLAGYVLGTSVGTIYIFVSSFLALPYAIFSSIRKKDNVLPFGPFLVISLLVLFWNIDPVLRLLRIYLGGH